MEKLHDLLINYIYDDEVMHYITNFTESIWLRSKFPIVIKNGVFEFD